jgi:nitroimidazol reductase NimA-like FMN-containing flavoprotein (pyridoxamine 5'-phosphate oxidase superfamily)
MIREMRRQDRLLSRPEAIAIMEKGDYGVLACSDCEYSYAVPLSYVWDDGVIFFHSARQGHKLDNLRANPRVSFAVVETFEALPGNFAANYRSAIAFGKAGEVLGAEKERALQLLLKKYAAGYWEEGLAYIARSKDNTTVMGITVEHITGKESRQA